MINQTGVGNCFHVFHFCNSTFPLSLQVTIDAVGAGECKNQDIIYDNLLRRLQKPVEPKEMQPNRG